MPKYRPRCPIEYNTIHIAAVILIGIKDILHAEALINAIHSPGKRNQLAYIQKQNAVVTKQICQARDRFYPKVRVNSYRYCRIYAKELLGTVNAYALDTIGDAMYFESWKRKFASYLFCPVGETDYIQYTLSDKIRVNVFTDTYLSQELLTEGMLAITQSCRRALIRSGNTRIQHAGARMFDRVYPIAPLLEDVTPLTQF